MFKNKNPLEVSDPGSSDFEDIVAPTKKSTETLAKEKKAKKKHKKKQRRDRVEQKKKVQERAQLRLKKKNAHMQARYQLKQSTASGTTQMNFHRQGVPTGDNRGSYTRNHGGDIIGPFTKSGVDSWETEHKCQTCKCHPWSPDFEFICRPISEKINGDWSQRKKCCFCNESKCPAYHKIYFTKRNTDKPYHIKLGTSQNGETIPHDHHGFFLQSQVPRVIKAEFTPERLEMSINPFVKLLRNLETTKHLKIQGERDPDWNPTNSTGGYCCAISQLRDLQRHYRKIFKRKQGYVVLKDVEDLYGTIMEMALRFQKVPAHDNDPYLIGIWIDSKHGYIIIIISTRLLLFNMFLLDIVPGVARADQIDDTFPRNDKKVALCVYGGTDMGQRFRDYAFALTNKTDAAAYQFILSKVCDAAEDVVQYFINRQIENKIAPRPPPFDTNLLNSSSSSSSSSNSSGYQKNPISFGSDKAHAAWAAAKVELAGFTPEEIRRSGLTGHTATFMSDAMRRIAFPTQAQLERNERQRQHTSRTSRTSSSTSSTSRSNKR